MSGNDEEDIDEVDLEDFGGDDVDYAHLFVTSKTFKDKNEACDWAKRVAIDNGFHLVKSSNKTAKGSKLPIFYLSCDRGVRRYRGVLKDPEKALRRKITTKKCNCSFSIKVRQLASGEFYIEPRLDRGKHNHRLTVYQDGRPSRGGFSDEQKEYIKSQMKAQVRPAHIRLGLHIQSSEKPQPKIHQLYNFIFKVRSEERDGRNHAQQMLLLATTAKYVHFTKKNSETDQLTHIFMAHPIGVSLFRTYWYVVLIDSTYKTNKYGLTLVELIGVSPDASIPSYQWMLEKLKSLLPDDSYPNAIVTDRELGLVSTVPLVFPNTRHLLCTWHVDCAVEARLKNTITDDNLVNAILNGYWRKIMRTTTNEEVLQVWSELESRHRRPSLISYLNRTWIPHLSKFSKCFINEVCHMGNTATSRVESAHSNLKKWLGSSTLKFDTIWTRVHALMEGQHVEIRALLEDSRSREVDRGLSLGAGLKSSCGCVIVKTHGLLCSCNLLELYDMGSRVHIGDIHVFWRTLTYEDSVSIPPSDIDRLNELFEEVRGSDLATIRGIAESIYSQLHPEDEDVEEPVVNEARKVRPKRSRNLSAFEHARRKHPASASRSRRTSTTIAKTSTTSARNDTNSSVNASGPLGVNYMSIPSPFVYGHLIPAAVAYYLRGYYDPKPDGHCATYTSMRGALLNELNDQRYYNIYFD
ncbi:hypothetical protein RND81_09G138600 [Saponaria officinalis]|uniref:MULE transposase domain-containing protein n=1 Tax=Saponaria officinalis TaxID=3572 RepID=A0AAW1IMK0_SAPOF